MRDVFKTLNKCTAVLTEEVSTGIENVYIAIDRRTYNDLLRMITEAKKEVLKDNVL